MDFNTILSHFVITGEVQEVKPLGNGLINDTYLVKTVSDNDPDYVLQRINNDIFKDIDLLQHNVEVVTKHIRKKLTQKGEKDLDRKVLSFVPFFLISFLLPFFYSFKINYYIFSLKA